MPAATLRIIAARIISFWLMTSASAGTSRNVLMKNCVQRIRNLKGAAFYTGRSVLKPAPAMEKNTTLVFDRTPVSRIISCAATFGSAALFFTYLAENAEDPRPLPMIGLILLFLGTLAAAVMQYGDHIYVNDYGVMYENKLLSLLGKRGQWVRWEDIIEVRESKEKLMILFSRDGRRVLIDAILGYAIARAEIVRRTPQAVLTGTLAPHDS